VSDAEPRTTRRRVVDALAEFLQTEAAGGAVLLVATALALVLANSPAQSWYQDLFTTKLDLSFGPFHLDEDFEHWINDGLMAVFFFVVGLEIKRELVVGELSSVRRAALPAVAALGGMVVPALVYVGWNLGDGATSRGWGIPMATDIAFALGLLAVFGTRIPSGLRLFLLSLAIVDDIGAIIVIAVFYSDDTDVAWLLAAVVVIAVIVAMHRAGVWRISAYLAPALLLWLCTFESGVHATIAGVVLGLLTPVHPVRGRRVGEQLEHRLHPWTSFVIVPLFALANAGVELSADGVDAALHSTVTWGVVTGLVVGKPVGIALAVAVAQRFRLGEAPPGVSRSMAVGASVVAGIGFTVSLFVADLAFRSESLLDEAKLGVLAASLVAGALGAAVLLAATRRRAEHATRG
jgi:NhaA family Na+:H+ antiporter